jgi:hypothetical protein
MTGFWRSIYGLLGWSYWDEWSPRQRHLKYECCKQIERSKLILKKPSVDVDANKFVENKVSKKKVRISVEQEYIPPPPPNSPYSPKYAEHSDCITELRTLFKEKRKSSWNNKKSWRRQNALQTKILSKKQKVG